MAVKNYLDLAEDDYRFIMGVYESGNRGNIIASSSQNICEKYFKHLIDEFCLPESDEEKLKKEAVLKTHNLSWLMDTIKDKLGLTLERNDRLAIQAIGGYYFNTRYPGDGYFDVSEEGLSDCIHAIEVCRNFVLEKSKELTNSRKSRSCKELDEIIAECREQVVDFKKEGSGARDNREPGLD